MTINNLMVIPAYLPHIIENDYKIFSFTEIKKASRLFI